MSHNFCSNNIIQMTRMITRQDKFRQTVLSLASAGRTVFLLATHFVGDWVASWASLSAVLLLMSLSYFSFTWSFVNWSFFGMPFTVRTWVVMKGGYMKVGGFGGKEWRDALGGGGVKEGRCRWHKRLCSRSVWVSEAFLYIEHRPFITVNFLFCVLERPKVNCKTSKSFLIMLKCTLQMQIWH